MSADKLLDPAELLAAARRETGLSAFDTPPIDEPLERLIAEIPRSAYPTHRG